MSLFGRWMRRRVGLRSRPGTPSSRRETQGLDARSLRGTHVPSSPVSNADDATSSLTLTTGWQDVVGCTETINAVGRYLVIGVFYFEADSVDGQTCLLKGALSVGGARETPEARWRVDDDQDMYGTIMQAWLVEVTSGGTILKLQACKTSGAGSSKALLDHTTLTIVWLGA